MEFLNQNMLWAGLAAGIPVLIHLWNRKKSTLINWAATHWLTASQQTTSRGINFRDWWLLILRILAVLALTYFLAKPYFDSKKKKNVVLIYQETPEIKEEYKFEIENAERKFTEVKVIHKNIDLQQFINQNTSLFSENRATLILEPRAPRPVIFLPDTTILLFAQKTAENSKIVLKNGENYFFIEDNNLVKSSVLLENKNTHLVENEIITYSVIGEKSLVDQVEIALKSISKVYGLVFEKTGKNPDLYLEVFENEVIIKIKNRQEVINADQKNLSYEGILPEKILDKLLTLWDLKPGKDNFSEAQMKAGFEVNDAYFTKKDSNSSQYWALVFLILVTLERYFSIKKNK